MDFYDSSFNQQVSTIDRDKPVFVYCAIGGRSWDAAKIMHELGFKNVYDLKGGIIIWNKLFYFNSLIQLSSKSLSILSERPATSMISEIFTGCK